MALRFNRYNTKDAEMLLALKQQEDQALLQVVRLIEPNIDPEELIFIVINTIQRQLDVQQLMFVLREEGGTKEVMANYGLPRPGSGLFNELDYISSILRVATSNLEEMKAIGVEYVIPLGTEDSIGAWFLIADFAESEEETMNDLMFIETLGNIMTISLQNIRLFRERLENERIQRELDLAGKIQRLSLPSRFDILPELDIFARNLPHSTIGGDFFNLLQTGPRELYFFISDAAGKGTAAALLITNISANLNAMIRTGASFRQMVFTLHEAIGKLTNFEAFVTIFLGRIDLNENRIEYVNAGHNPPILTQHGQARELREGSIPLGIMEITDVKVGQDDFAPGDSLFLYTDGMVEQTDPNDELFGEERVHAFVHENLNRSSNALVKLAFRAIAQHARGTEFEDDVTVMNIRYRPK